MLTFLTNICCKSIRISSRHCRNFASANVEKDEKRVSQIRNVAIVAHIDAGKTTTTERILFASGVTDSMGNVDAGNTVTDFMAQERERGITITSAVVSVPWETFRMNLIDTPGHVDFSVEVERTMRVVEGVVIILDSSAGVQAQTINVWRQAVKRSLPALIYLNKMDKPGANVEMCLKSVREKLGIEPLLMQCLPDGDASSGKGFNSLIDLVRREKLIWIPNKVEKTDTSYVKQPVAGEDVSPSFSQSRETFISKLAETDSRFGNVFVEAAQLDDISTDDMHTAVRRCTVSKKLVPVFCGSSLQNKGIQPLLNAICRYLPSPLQQDNTAAKLYQPDLCALAFKTMHDKHRGALTFLRIYSGSLQPKSVYNATQAEVEVAQKIYLPHADELEEVKQVEHGNIALAMGLKVTKTGDTLVTNRQAVQSAIQLAGGHKGGGEAPCEILPGIEPIEPVFFCSIEPPSERLVEKFKASIQQLLREDPSLHCRFDEESQQTVLEGLGELHMEVVKDRLLREYGLKVFMGPLQVKYRESIGKEASISETVQTIVKDAVQTVCLGFTVSPMKHLRAFDKLELKIVQTDSSLANIKPYTLEAIENGVRSALDCGPLLGFPVHGIHVRLDKFWKQKSTSEIVSASAAQILGKLLLKANPTVLEPMATLVIDVDQDHTHAVLHDLAQRRGEINHITNESTSLTLGNVVYVTVPLAEMRGYSTELRCVSSGLATVHMEPAGYKLMPERLWSKVMTDGVY